MTPGQIKRARWMMSEAGLTDYKEDLVLTHSSGRTKSLTAMTYDESKSLFEALNGFLQIPPSPAEKMRNTILSLAHEMKWHRPGTRKINMDKVNGWCVDKFKDTLDDLPYLELCKAVTAFKTVHEKYLKGI